MKSAPATTREFTGLVAAITRGDASAVRLRVERAGFGVRDFGILLLRHQVAATVFTDLDRHGLTRLFPADFVEDLKGLYLAQWEKNERTMACVRELSAAFTRAGRDAIVLKGPVFALRYYGDLDRRAVLDIDWLVRDADVPFAESLLAERGFRRASRVLISRTWSARFTHHFEYLRAGAKVELHWALDRHGSYRIDYGRLWADRRTFTENGHAHGVLSDEYELVGQILSVFRDLQTGTFALKSFVDLYRLIRAAHAGTSWEAFFAARHGEGIGAVSRGVLDLFLDVFEAREDFPELERCLAKGGARPRDSDPRRLSLLDRRAPAWGNKAWAFRLLDGGSLRGWGWWAASLPFRLAVHVKCKPEPEGSSSD